jgi:stearoyl-CoA desaturase (delta-9 desaturase)
MKKPQLDWTNTLFLAFTHLVGLFGVVYLAAIHFSWWTVGLGVLWFGLCGLSITGGYHRLFAHPTYQARWPLRLFYLCFGAASAQNSALKWSADHRLHHSKTDRDGDPYNIKKGFWWAHIVWVLCKSDDKVLPPVKDLEADPLIRFQHRYYVPLAILTGAVLPGLIGLAWGDPIGAVLIAGFLRLVVQWHATFSINSVAHWIGKQPYSTEGTARDSFITAIITLGEGYHNFHHKFQADYRNGIKWYHLDPTKWFVWTMSKIGVTWNLRRTPDEAIQRARQAVLVQVQSTRRP